MRINYVDNSRDFDDPRYKAWRFSVFSLCDFTCTLCHRKGGELQAHHIVRWADAPNLRFAASNGVTLCTICHKLVTGREDDYRDYFQKYIRQRIQLKKGSYQKRMRKYKKQKSDSEASVEESSDFKRKKRRLRFPKSRF